MLTRAGVAFAGLNVLRILSIVATILVFAATLEVMVNDGRLVAAARREEPEVWEDCEYVPDTDVPTHTWGLFWTQLDRTFVLILCIICFFSEANWGGYCEKAFQLCLPVLGRTSGTGALGGLQMMIGANLLSHYSEGFPLVTAWLLFFVGLINFLFGISLKQPAKDYRSFSPARRLAARLDGPARGSNTSDLEKGGQSACAGGARTVRTVSEAFGQAGAAVVAHQELLRAQARQANDKVERETEARLASDLRGDSKHHLNNVDGSARSLSGAFLYDSEQGTNIVVGHPPTRATNYSLPYGMVLSRQNSGTVASPPYTRDPTPILSKVGPAEGRTVASTRGVSPRNDHSRHGGFKRKSLALAKATRKRLSDHSTAPSNRRSFLWGQGTHAVPSLTRRRLAQQAERERAQLLRLAAELKLPHQQQAHWQPVDTHVPKTTTETRSVKSTYSSGVEGEERPPISYSPTSTTGFTSVSRAQSRFGTDEEMGESFHVDADAPPLPAYEPLRLGSTAPIGTNSTGTIITTTDDAATTGVPSNSTGQRMPRTQLIAKRLEQGDLSTTPIARQWASEMSMRDHPFDRLQTSGSKRAAPTKRPPPRF